MKKYHYSIEGDDDMSLKISENKFHFVRDAMRTNYNITLLSKTILLRRPGVANFSWHNQNCNDVV